MTGNTEQLTSPDVWVLTGTIGSGKSTVADQLAGLGAGVVSADRLAREVVAPGSDALEEIKWEFGDGVLSPGGGLDRKKLAEIVFRDPAKRARLEAITHPRIRILGDERFASLRAAGKPLLVYDCPLFFEAGLNRRDYRGVIVVSADERQCLSRVMARDGMTEEQARLRLEQQMPTSEKIKRADHVLDNSGTVEELAAKVSELFERLTKPSA